MTVQNLKGLSLVELQEFVESIGEKKYRAIQIYQWLYAKFADDLEQMTNISKEFRSILSQKAKIYNLKVLAKNFSGDGTIKYLFGLEDGMAIESVLIPTTNESSQAEKRLTLCVSTQVGCSLGCKFCATGFIGFRRNLTAGEIVDQVIQVQKLIDKRITNIVFMGMGEPLLNYDNLMKSIEIINDDHGLNIGARHITVSTAGYADKIYQMADEKRTVKLALSLNTLDNEKRTKIMPITKKYPVRVLIDALEYYYNKTKKRPTFEYILFEGFNDCVDDVKALKKLAGKVPCKVNLIPYNSIDFIKSVDGDLILKPASKARIELFADALRREGLTVMVRNSSGADINAACGQLAVTSLER